MSTAPAFVGSADAYLDVQGLSIEALYRRHVAGRFFVNRRYQRKLVWLISEKQTLIDSMLQGLPLPLILLAERGAASRESDLEIIDGLQRLNAIVGFIENRFPLPEQGYFDLTAFSVTNQAMRNGDLEQLQPVLSAERSTALLGYTLPVSTFRVAADEAIDLAFRRINSSGVRLSKQEIRQAGTTTSFATLVRRLASHIRGDESTREVVGLSDMEEYSVGSQGLDYGIDPQAIFWVKHRVLSAKDVRTSKDEEVVADLLADILLDEPGFLGTRQRDAIYGVDESDLSEVEIRALQDGVEHGISAAGGEAVVEERFRRGFAALREMLDASGVSLDHLIFDGNPGRGRQMRRYFHAIQSAILRQYWAGEELLNAIDAAEALRGIAKARLQIPPGGDWNFDSRGKNIAQVRKALKLYFGANGDGHTIVLPGRQEIANLLYQARAEAPAFELKQGFLRLDDTRALDTRAVQELKSAAAMANTGPGTRGFLLYGIADSQADAARIRKFDGIVDHDVHGFPVVGIEREARQLGWDLARLRDWLTDQIRGSGLTEWFSTELMQRMEFRSYADHVLLIVPVAAGREPVFYDDDLYIREGASKSRLEIRRHGEVWARFGS